MQKISAGKFHFEPPFTSFDHLVGAGEQRRRDFEAERPRGLKINDKLELKPVGAQTLAKRSPTPPSAAKPPKKPPERRPRPDVVHSSVYLPEAVYEALREAAFNQARGQQ
jgi:hypothetical protein